MEFDIYVTLQGHFASAENVNSSNIWSRKGTIAHKSYTNHTSLGVS